MLVWFYKMKERDTFGRFYVTKSFAILLDWNPYDRGLNNRWKASVSLKGMQEFGVGRSPASALISLYTVISENYASIDEYHFFLKTNNLVRHRI